MNVQIWILFLLNFNGATSLSSHKWQDSDFLGIFFTDSSEAYVMG